jgi:hypothetical protein
MLTGRAIKIAVAFASSCIFPMYDARQWLESRECRQEWKGTDQTASAVTIWALSHVRQRFRLSAPHPEGSCHMVRRTSASVRSITLYHSHR